MKSRELEAIAKGFSNHHRIDILNLLNKEPDLSLLEISQELSINFKTASEHSRRLALAGLIAKKYKGAAVMHRLTKRGVSILMFLRTLE